MKYTKKYLSVLPESVGDFYYMLFTSETIHGDWTAVEYPLGNTNLDEVNSKNKSYK